MFFKLTEDRRVRPTTGVVEQVLKRFQENIWNSKPGQARRSNNVPECVYWLQRVAHLGCRLLASILFITQQVVVLICDRLSLRLHTCAAPLLRLVVGCCWFAWTLWIPWYDSLKLLALIDCTSQSHFHFCQLQIASIWRRAHPFWAQRRREATPRRPFSTALMSTWRTSHIERIDPLSI